MTSTILRSMSRISRSSLRTPFSQATTISVRSPPRKSSISESMNTAAFTDSGASSRPAIGRSRILSRFPVELGCCDGSMYPLHSVVAGAKLTSRLSMTSQGCRDLSQGTLCCTSPGL